MTGLLKESEQIFGAPPLLNKKIEQGSFDAILPEISGRAWITGTHQYMLDPADPWPGGYRISDTWGV